MSATLRLASGRRGRQARRRTRLGEAGAMAFGVLLAIWTLMPLYNMVLVAVQQKEDVFSTNIWPPAPTLGSFVAVWHETYWLLANFWRQMGNSAFIGIAVAFLTLAIGTLTSFTISRLRIRQGPLLTNAALLTYVIPMSFLAIPFYGIMRSYGLADNAWSVIAVEVTFATPYAIFIFQQYGAAAGLERISVCVPAAVLGKDHHGAGGTWKIPEQRRGPLELSDGRRNHLRAAATGDLLCVPATYEQWVDDGGCEGVNRAGD